MKLKILRDLTGFCKIAEENTHAEKTRQVFLLHPLFDNLQQVRQIEDHVTGTISYLRQL
ncbi:MAG: hypothetical protein SFU87_05290 [Chitinophagaceae bacterium]|nr:hypothetical protein [Chitinophagaceae bacterium]